MKSNSIQCGNLLYPRFAHRERSTGLIGDFNNNNSNNKKLYIWITSRTLNSHIGPSTDNYPIIHSKECFIEKWILDDCFNLNGLHELCIVAFGHFSFSRFLMVCLIGCKTKSKIITSVHKKLKTFHLSQGYYNTIGVPCQKVLISVPSKLRARKVWQS